MPGSYPGEPGSIPGPATNARPARGPAEVPMIVLAILLSLVALSTVFPLILIYWNWCNQQDDDDNPAAIFEDAFTRKTDP